MFEILNKCKPNNFLIGKLICLSLLIAGIIILPVSAQIDFNLEQLPNLTIYQPDTKAAIAVDGRSIFEISNTNLKTAKERSATVNAEIKTAIASSQAPKIEIKQRNNSPIIYLNDRYLLTVTQDDVTKGNSPEQQADIWVGLLNTQIQQAKLTRSPAHIREKSILAIIILIVVIAGDRILCLLKNYSFSGAIVKLIPGINPAHLESPNLGWLFKTKLIFARILLWLATIYWLSGLFPQSSQFRNQIIGILGSIFQTSLFTLGDRPYSIIDLLILGGMFWGLFIAIQTLTNLLRTRVLNQTRMSRGSQEVIFIIVKYSLISFGTIILLQVWGLNLSSLAILGSALGVGIGFGFQDIAKNFASGVVLLFERSVQIGDFIEVSGHQGTVERIQARSIVLKTLDSVSIVVPNSRLLADEVINWSHDNPTSRFKLPVGVAYGSDPEVVKVALLQVAQENSKVLNYPPPQVFFVGLGDSSLDFELLVWIADPSRQPVVKSELYFCIEKILRDRDIEIPFPQRDLHLRGDFPRGISPELETAMLQWLKRSDNRSSN